MTAKGKKRMIIWIAVAVLAVGLAALAAPDQGLFPKYDAGLYTEGNTNMIVSRGIGNSLFPFRFNNRPEVVLTQLQSK